MPIETTNPILPVPGPVLFHFNGVPVVVQPGFWPAPVLLTGLLAWAAGRRNPRRTLPQRLGAALLAMPVMLFADIGHALAHTISARLAGAPTDEVLLCAGMPRTLYANNAVAPHLHIARSLGGPVFSSLFAMLSEVWRRRTVPGTLSRDLADASLLANGLIFAGGLVPMPYVDGGVILKWSMVQTGKSEAQADRVVKAAGIVTVAAVAGGLIGWLLRRKR